MRASQHPYGLRLPGNIKIKVINVVPQCYYKDAVYPGGRDWAELWSDFNVPGWIKPQIDLAFASGANGIKIGCSGMPGNLNPYPSNSVLAARLRAVAAYVASLGGVMYVSVGPSGPNYEWFNADGTLDSTKLAGGRFVLSVLDTIPNIVGVDLCNEINFHGPASWGSGNTTAFSSSMVALYGAARAVCALPMTCSVYLNSANDWAGSWMQSIAAFADFQDGHPYYQSANNTPTVNDVSSLVLQRWFSGRFLIGEVGVNQSTGASTQSTFINGVGALAAHSSCRGAVLFSGADYSNSDNGSRFGVSDETAQNPRPAILTPFAAWPGKLA